MANFFENLRIAIQLKKTALEFLFHLIFHIVLVLTYKRKEFKNQEIEEKCFKWLLFDGTIGKIG